MKDLIINTFPFRHLFRFIRCLAIHKMDILLSPSLMVSFTESEWTGQKVPTVVMNEHQGWSSRYIYEYKMSPANEHLCFVHGFSSKNTAIGSYIAAEAELIWKEDFITLLTVCRTKIFLELFQKMWKMYTGQVSSQIQSLTEFISWKFK